MLFQTLDNKKECYAIFCNEIFYHYPNSLDLTRTWSWTSHFSSIDIEYAQIWCNGRSLGDVCPEDLRLQWEQVNYKAKAFITSFHESKINLDDICFYDAVPKKFLLEYNVLKNKITNFVFEHYKKPKNYDFLSSLVVFLDKINKQELNLRAKNLDFINPKVRANFNKIKQANNFIEYTPWVTATGRLSTTQKSFPILNLNKELRNVIIPQNDLFIELDYNSAELRTFLGLLGKDQPSDDLHSWIQKNIFKGRFTREETKKKVFSWLYNPKASNKKLNSYFDRDLLLNKYYINGVVSTPYGRTIEVDDERALNYTIQSTASDLFLTAAMRVDEALSKSKSFISFCVHDSLIIDFAKEDKHMINELVEEFSKNIFGSFKTNLSIGKDYGSMRLLR